jgi:hypothetical protein
MSVHDRLPPVRRPGMVMNYKALCLGQTAVRLFAGFFKETPLHPGVKETSERVERLLKA